MTHTLHRFGNRETLLEDYPILAHIARGHNDRHSEERLRKISEIFLKHTDLNYGCAVVGNKYTTDISEIFKNVRVGVHAVFKCPKALIACMKELKDADLGISIVVSGCFDIVDECCKMAGIEWHLREYSLGFHGNTSLLPEDPYLEILTMCGHGMVAKRHIDHLIKQIKKGKLTCERVGFELAKPCLCGIFNPHRAAQIVRLIVESSG